MGTKRDFHVKTGLTVDSGDVTLSNGNLVIGSGEAQIDNITINANTISSTDTNGAINLTPQGSGSVVISKVDINDGTVDNISSLTASGDLDIGAHDFRAQTLTADGLTSGRVVFAGTNGVLSNDSDLTFSGDTLTATKIAAFTAAGAIDFDDQNMTNVDIDSGAIDGTTIGAASAATGSFTTANVSTALNVTGRAAISSNQASNISLKVTGASGQSADIFEVNVHGGTEKLSVSSDGTTVIATADINGGAIDGTTIGAASAAAGTFSSLTATTADINGGTIDGATVGANSATTGKFTTLEATGDIDLTGSGGSIKGDGTAAITIDTNGQITKLGQDTPSDGQVLTWDNSSGYIVWSPSASGADGMGSGFTVSATTDTNATTITQGDDLFFAALGGLTAETTADGTVTHGLDINGLTEATIASGDMIAFSDEATANDPTRKESIDHVAALFAGAGLTATNAVIAVDADQSGQITSVGALTGLSTAADATIDLNGGAITIDGTTLSIDSTDTTNLTMTANSSSGKTLTIDAANSGSGAASIAIGTTSGTSISIGHTTSTVTVNDNLVVTGDLTINGATTTISTTNSVVEDSLIELNTGATSNSNDLGFILERGSTGDNAAIIWDESATKFVVGTTTATGASTGGISVTTGTLVANIEGDLTGTASAATLAAKATALNTTSNGIVKTTSGNGTISIGSLSSGDIPNNAADTSGNAATATLASTVTVTDNESTDENNLIAFIADAASSTGAQSLEMDGDLTYNPSTGRLTATQLAGTLQTAAQTNITSLGTLSALTVDTVKIDGTTIGRTDDTDLISLPSSGNMIVNGDLVANAFACSSLMIDSISVSSSATELNRLDGATAGTVVASKAVVVDSNKDIGSFRNVTATGALKSDGMQLTGGANSAADSGTVVAEFDVSEASASMSSATTIANYAFGTYRTAKFLVQIGRTDASEQFDSLEIMMNYDGGSAPSGDSDIFMTTYGYVSTGTSDLGTFNAVKNTSSNTIDLQFTPATSGTYEYRVVKSLLIK